MLVDFSWSRLRGELGILKKKHSALNKDLTDQKENISGLTANLSKLETKIVNLEKDKVRHNHVDRTKTWNYRRFPIKFI